MSEFSQFTLHLAYNFKPTTIYWDTLGLSGDDHTFKRSKPAPFLKFLFEINKKYPFKNIIEIGACRFSTTQKCLDYFNKDIHTLESPACCADGHSTYFLSKLGGNFYSVDIDDNRITSIKNCFNNLNEKLPENLHFAIPHDGILFLEQFKEKIDLLFLDGWDVGSTDYAENHLKAFEVCKNKLTDNSVIVIDDTDFRCSEGGKDKLVGPALIDNGFVPILKGRQTIFIRT